MKISVAYVHAIRLQKEIKVVDLTSPREYKSYFERATLLRLHMRRPIDVD
jgi:hypothetical protein